MIRKKTKIICTMGPSTENQQVIEKMIEAGMNVVRLNFSHGSYDNFTQLIKTIRQASQKTGKTVAIMQDLQGPKIRVGEMPPDGVMLTDGGQVILTARDIKGDEKNIPIQYKELVNDVNKGDKILLCDGLIELEVLSVEGPDIHCKILVGGIVKTKKGINVPTASISANPLTDKDKKDLEFGLKNDVDYVALSFVRSAENIEELRELIREHQGNAKIIVKLERHEAIENLESIIHATDAIMVARGDLGVELPFESVPIHQKRIIKLSNLHGKPVITATEMMQSMVESARPTRAEVSDCANAILDYTDAVMLSNESAVGKHPALAALALAKIAAATEAEMKKNWKFTPRNVFNNKLPTSYAICESAAHLAGIIDAKLIVAYTESGFSARHIAKHRCFTPIVAITPSEKVERQLQLVWGINNVIIHKTKNFHPIHEAKELLIQHKLVKPDDKIVIVSNASTDEKIVSTLTI